MYVCQLPADIQNNIKNDLIAAGINGKFLEDAMCSRLYDLSDTIDIDKYLFLMQ